MLSNQNGHHGSFSVLLAVVVIWQLKLKREGFYSQLRKVLLSISESHVVSLPLPLFVFFFLQEWA